MKQAKIAAVILAAGSSERYGKPKQLLEWEGRPLITYTADTAWAAGLDPLVVVLGANNNDNEPALANRPVQIVHNYRWREGLSSSLYAGVANLPASVDAALFLPADQPFVTADFLKEIVSHWRSSGSGIVAPQTPAGERGTPVLFSRRYFPELAQLSGDAGGRQLIQRYADDVAWLSVADPWIFFDLDTPEAYAAAKEHARSVAGNRDLQKVRGVICDMDGVLWRGDSPLPGLQEFIAFLSRSSLNYILATNNSSLTPDQYVQKLARMGVSVSTEHVLNSAMAAARYISKHHPGASVFAIGGPGVMEALTSEGLRLSEDSAAQQADYVVVGWDRSLTWHKLAAATRLILKGAAFVGTNPDRTYPLEDGLVPGNGAQLAALECATGVSPVVAGKPAPLLYEQAMEQMGTTPETTLVIGDRLDTDILGALQLGIPTALVLTGITQREEVSESMIRPTYIFDDLQHMLEVWCDR